MLVQLSIRDIVLIDRLDLDFGSGLTILTGETGAGKSILLDAFSLALGARGDGSLVREGERYGQVTAVFELERGHAAREAAAQQGIVVAEDLILRRVQFADGRTRAYVNDQAVNAQTLRGFGRSLVELHGQHDDRAMVDPSAHRQLVDAFGGLSVEVETVRQAHSHLRALEAERLAEEERLAVIRAKADYLRHAHAELTQLAVAPAEETTLAERRQDLQAAEKIVVDLQDTRALLAGDGLVTNLHSSLRRLDRRQGQAPHLVGPSVRAIDDALAALDSVRDVLDQAVTDADFDPAELENIEERLFAIRAAARKYDVAADALPALAVRFGETLAELEADEAKLKRLAGEIDDARTAYGDAATELSDMRSAAANALDAAVNAELAPLKLETARFITQIARDQSGPEGLDTVTFWVSTNPGTRPGPLIKIASGGELARIMLALKVSLAAKGSAPTLVFDEIDTGVGGAVADAMGQRLARLASKAQVLAVTHAPQVAARAKAHYRIAKNPSEAGRRVATRVAVLSPDARQEEIARMLAGATITDEARAAAGRLLAETR